MKHPSTLIVALLLSIACHMQAKDRVIETPPFCVRNTTSIEASRVVISDTATILHIYAKYRPNNWIKIAPESYLKDNNGEVYQLRSGIGIVPGQEFWMPQSGEATFQLVFPPLPKHVTSIDFTEGEGVEGAFSIWGIQLDGKKLPQLMLPKGATVHRIDKNKSLPEPEMKYGTATLKGVLLDYKPGMPKEISIYLLDPVRLQKEVKVKVADDGSFSATATVCGITPAVCYEYSPEIYFYMAPEETTELFINQRELSRLSSKFRKNDKPGGERVYINGPLADLAQELSGIKTNRHLMSNLNEVMKVAEEMNPATFKAYILEKSATVAQELKKQSLSRAARELLEFEQEVQVYNSLQSATNMMMRAYTQKNQIDREAQNELYKKLQESLPEDYVPSDILKQLNKRPMLLSPAYSKAISYTSFLRSRPTAGTDAAEGVLAEVETATALYRSITGFKLLSDGQMQKTASLPQAYKELLLAANAELAETIEANKKKTGFTIHETGEVANEELFASIIGKFKGKVLLVDFWATWCGPCRMANKEMIHTKEELKKENIVYLYITGETSPIDTWKNMIPDIHGDHFRVSNEQWNYLGNAFKIEGVPTYLIIDRNGDTTFRQTGFPGREKIKEELLKVLN